MFLSMDLYHWWWTLECIICPVVSVRSQDLYHWWWTISPRGLIVHQSVFPSQDRYHWWWTISPRLYHPSSSQCFYWIYTTDGGLIVLECIIRPVVSVSITDLYHWWWTISPRVYHPSSSQCFYHWIYTTDGGLLVLECISPVVSV